MANQDEPVIDLHEVDPQRKPRGRVILLTLLAMIVLFGVGLVAGRAITGNSLTSSQPCVTETAVPSFVPAAEITVKVLNASAPTGSAAKAGSALGAQNINVIGAENGTTSNPASGAIIRYGPEGLPAAESLAVYLDGNVVLEPAPELAGNDLQLVLASEFGGVAAPETVQQRLNAPVISTSGDCN